MLLQQIMKIKSNIPSPFSLCWRSFFSLTNLKYFSVFPQTTSHFDTSLVHTSLKNNEFNVEENDSKLIVTACNGVVKLGLSAIVGNIYISLFPLSLHFPFLLFFFFLSLLLPPLLSYVSLLGGLLVRLWWFDSEIPNH